MAQLVRQRHAPAPDSGIAVDHDRRHSVGNLTTQSAPLWPGDNEHRVHAELLSGAGNVQQRVYAQAEVFAHFFSDFFGVVIRLRDRPGGAVGNRLDCPGCQQRGHVARKQLELRSSLAVIS